MLDFKLFVRFPNLAYGLSEKADGSMKFFEPIQPQGADTVRNRAVYLARFGVDLTHTVAAGLVHGMSVVKVSDNDAGTRKSSTDGLITAEQGLFLTVTVADCIPVYFFDPVRNVVALVHGGWLGLSGGIIARTVGILVSDFQCKPQDILVGLGPCIQQCHYEVQQDVAQLFADFPECIDRLGGRTYLDLPGVVEQQLLAGGLTVEHIEKSPLCTFDLADTYFSRRRDRSKPLEVMLAFIGFKKQLE